MSDITDRIIKLAAEHQVSATELMIPYLEKEQRLYDKALAEDMKRGDYSNIMGPRPEVQEKAYKILERYARMKYR